MKSKDPAEVEDVSQLEVEPPAEESAAGEASNPLQGNPDAAA